jgi:hypothetical protein
MMPPISTEVFKVVKYPEYSPTNILHFLSIRYAFLYDI